MSRLGEIHRKPDSLARMRMSQGQKGKRIPPRTIQQKEKIQRIQLSQREVYSEAGKKAWSNPEKRDEMLSKILASSHIRPNKTEHDLNILIDKACPDEYEYTGDGQVIIGGMCPDFTNINGQKKVIEMFGDYWHQGQDPQVKIDKYAQYGFSCLVIWEKELREKTKQELIEMIKVFNNMKSNSEERHISVIKSPVQLSMI